MAATSERTWPRLCANWTMQVVAPEVDKVAKHGGSKQLAWDVALEYGRYLCGQVHEGALHFNAARDVFRECMESVFHHG